MFNCQQCGKLVVNIEEMGNLCTACWDEYNKAMEPRLTVLDRIILWIFEKHATYKHQVTKGPDPYAGHNLEIKLPKGLVLKVSNVIDWVGYLGEAFFNEDDWWIMPIAKRIFYAFEAKDAVAEYHDGYGSAHSYQ